MPCLDIIASEPGQIFCFDEIDKPALDILQHPLECRTVVVQAGIAVVYVAVKDADALLFAIALQHHLLGFDAAGIPGAGVVPGQAQVQGRAVDLLFQFSDPPLIETTWLWWFVQPLYQSFCLNAIKIFLEIGAVDGQ